MANIIYNYPKSSCPELYLSSIKPYNTYRVTEYNQILDYGLKNILNPEIQNKNVAKDFIQISSGQLNGGVVYTSPDPRLINTANYMKLELDKPPMDTTIKLSDVYNKDLLNFGKKYTSYKDITGGQITYYINNTDNDQYYQTLFTKDIQEEYIDPMSSKYIEYSRVPITKNNPLTDTINNNSGFCLNWMKDTMYNREDNMSYARTAINKQSVLN